MYQLPSSVFPPQLHLHHPAFTFPPHAARLAPAHSAVSGKHLKRNLLLDAAYALVLMHARDAPPGPWLAAMLWTEPPHQSQAVNGKEECDWRVITTLDAEHLPFFPAVTYGSRNYCSLFMAKMPARM